MVFPTTDLRCRQIDGGDIATVASLLTRGFPKRDRQYWLRAFAQLTERESPPGLPKYGYLMESEGVPVGTILLICSTMRTGDAVVQRCNFSSWYVEPKFRVYGSLLLSQALQHKEATYLNISPSRHTWAKIEAQGFSRYCDGFFVAFPMVNGLLGGVPAKVFSADRKPEVDFDPFDQEVLEDHAAHGCMSLMVRDARTGLPVRFPCSPGQDRRTMRADDLLPRCRRLHPPRGTDWTLSRAARPTACHRRRERPNPRPHRYLPSRPPQIFQGPTAPASR